MKQNDLGYCHNKMKSKLFLKFPARSCVRQSWKIFETNSSDSKGTRKLEKVKLLHINFEFFVHILVWYYLL